MATSWKLIGRGKAGWHADGLSDGNKVFGSGGTLEGYAVESADGTVVYDAEESDTGDFTVWVVNGPMVDVSLPTGTISRFGDHKTLAAMLPALGGAYQTLGIMALMQKDCECKLGSFDMLALDVYLPLFKEAVKGVKWGTIQNGAIVWDTP